MLKHLFSILIFSSVLASCSDEPASPTNTAPIVVAAQPLSVPPEMNEITPIERQGEIIYQQSCSGCHSAGVAGAPMLNDKAAWEKRSNKGLDALIANVKNGIKAMPPKGMCGDCSDAELKNTIEYILTSSGAMEAIDK